MIFVILMIIYLIWRNISVPQPKDKEGLLALRDQLQETKEMQAYRLLQEKFSRLLEQSQRQMESAMEPALLFRSQGEIVAYRKAISGWDDLLREVSTAISSIVETQDA